ncbi:MAG TPA: biotin/lipoyl-containing protein [Acidobacteriaceae bacterium]|jgi:biotin carboxyl carrier protein|nr:biotin/lipoyl-containing protein [Acidobacteriaceae bacterium]
MKLDLEIDGQLRHVEILAGQAAGPWSILIDGEPVEADACLVRPGVLSLLIAGQSHRIVLDANLSHSTATEAALHHGQRRIPWQAGDPRSLRSRHRAAGATGPVTLKASMPGRVVRVLVDPGDTVTAHQGVLVLEAMKMQNELKSPREGRVTQLRVMPGDTVAAGDILAIIE